MKQINGMRSYDLYRRRVNMVCVIMVCIHAQYDSSVLAFDCIGNKRMTQYN